MVKNGPIRLRDPNERDLAPLVDLYNHYVATSHVTFDVEPKTLADRRLWLQGFSPHGPHRLIVAESAGRVIGYSSSTQFRHKVAYRKSVETTIYLASEFTGRGIGVELYAALLDHLYEHDDVHYAYAVRSGAPLPPPVESLLELLARSA